MPVQLSLYPICEPYNTGFMSADGHDIYYEECGNPYGKPAVFPVSYTHLRAHET